jgi:hypothetical protein
MRSASSRCGWVGAVLLLVTASAVDVAADAPKFDGRGWTIGTSGPARLHDQLPNAQVALDPVNEHRFTGSADAVLLRSPGREGLGERDVKARYLGL